MLVFAAAIPITIAAGAGVWQYQDKLVELGRNTIDRFRYNADDGTSYAAIRGTVSDILDDKLMLTGRFGAEKAIQETKTPLFVLSVTSSALPLPENPLVVNKRVSITDFSWSNLKQSFDECADDIHQFDRVLVHCEYGVSRSATIVIAYLMKHHKMTLQQAFEHTQQRRTWIKPNRGFWNQLEQYEKDLAQPQKNK